MKLLVKLLPIFSILPLSDCKGVISIPNSSKSSSANSQNFSMPSVDIRVATNGLNTQTVTLNNNSAVNINSMTVPQISSALSSSLTEDIDRSSCTHIIFPLTPGSSCTYLFKSTHTTDTVLGIKSRTIDFSISFTDDLRQDVSLPAKVIHYLYTGTNLGVYHWEGNTWSAIALSVDGTHIVAGNGSYFTAPGSIYTAIASSNVNIFNSNTWQAVTGSGTTPDNINALILDSALHTYAGSTDSNANQDVNEYKNGAWTALNSNDTLSNVSVLTLGTQVEITSFL